MKVYLVMFDVFYEEGIPEKIFKNKEDAEDYILVNRSNKDLGIEDYSLHEMELE